MAEDDGIKGVASTMADMADGFAKRVVTTVKETFSGGA